MEMLRWLISNSLISKGRFNWLFHCQKEAILSYPGQLAVCLAEQMISNFRGRHLCSQIRS